MNRIAFFFALPLLAPLPILAVDGLVLINQSTVLAAGGYPYVITQPGGYKLSGNLTAPVNTAAIAINSANVTLDLNGFTVQCSGQAGMITTCITSSRGPNISVQNGIVIGSLAPGGAGLYALSGIVLGDRAVVQDVRVQLNDDSNNVAFEGSPIDVGTDSIIRRNTFYSQNPPFISCPSVVVENVNATHTNLFTSGCVVANNIGIN